MNDAVSGKVSVGDDALSPRTRRFLTETRLGHLIDGELVLSADGATMPVIDPNTGREFVRVAQGSAVEVDRAAQAARRAFEDGRWRNLPPMKKEAVLRRLGALLEEHREVLMDLDMLDGGIIRAQTPFFVQFGIDVTNYYAGWPSKIEGAMSPTGANLVVQQVREPVGWSTAPSSTSRNTPKMSMFASSKARCATRTTSNSCNKSGARQRCSCLSAIARSRRMSPRSGTNWAWATPKACCSGLMWKVRS
ncbi:MAG: hypothetical protein AzoDbin1_03546 [Azoarcus sp.]|nr:hypothetical protein [Azoarcus sp.]